MKIQEFHDEHDLRMFCPGNVVWMTVGCDLLFYHYSIDDFLKGETEGGGEREI